MNFIIAICLYIISINGDALGHPEKRSRVYGGTIARISDFPFVASIRTYDTNQLICGSTIITKWNLLTAAHCVFPFNYDYSNLRVYTGTADSVAIAGDNFKIDLIYIHPFFSRQINTHSVLRNDIALVKLLTPITFNEYQNKINLPTRAPFSGNMALVAGWGLFEDSLGVLTSARLRKTSVVLADHTDCQARSPYRISEAQFCSVREAGVGICTGDGGGPVVSNGEIYGIIAYSYRCAQGYPDIHTKVYNYLNFITTHWVE